ncbi:MAG: HlyD family efflux transporter periplasmic adaptor subunit [Thermoguttaceae bacterium]
MRKSMIFFAVALAACLVEGRLSAAPVTLPDCLVTLIEEVQVPAEEAGVLTELLVVEGQQVTAGQLLAKIDDAHTRMQHDVAKFRLQVAEEEANNDTNVQYAAAASKVAYSEHQRALRANKQVPNSVPPAEVERLLLTYRRTLWEIEQATVNKRIAALEAAVSQAEVKAAAENLNRRRITSPLDGMVIDTYRHAGEWVKPGDPVMHIVRLNQLNIDGFLNLDEYMPSDIQGRPVTVRVKLAGDVETFSGKIVYVSPEVRAGNEYQIRAKVDNRVDKQSGRWLVGPGMDASMTIDVK